jgi:hypothetical protein
METDPQVFKVASNYFLLEILAFSRQQIFDTY